MDQENQFNQPNISQEPQPSFQPEIPKRFGLSRWAYILIIVSAVVVVGLVSWAAYRAFVSTPTESPTEEEEINSLPVVEENAPADETANETADWQIYRNEEYGFEMRYPGDWREQQTTRINRLELITEFLPEGGDPAYAFGDHLTVSIEENKEKLTLEELIESFKKNLNYIYGNEKYGKLDGHTSFEGKVINMGQSILYQVLVIKDNNIFNISYEYFYEESLERFNQILSTFKFIE